MFGNPRYPTYQVFLTIGIAAVVTTVLMPFFIRLMRHEGVGQQIRADGPERHLIKQGTPTMGGVVMLCGVMITCAIQARWTADLVLAVTATLVTGSVWTPRGIWQWLSLMLPTSTFTPLTDSITSPSRSPAL